MILFSRILVLEFVFSLTSVLSAVAPNPPAEIDMPSATVLVTLTDVTSLILDVMSYVDFFVSVVVLSKVTYTL